ncbi:class I adenylate-forming enzyme family protein [Streptomyces alanosinicus]|uniref:AMP-dependent synthetase n=1 Tax=Streptomyces alanosinicus TaxID=68171 RepID=A0A918YBZ1_9ACTN|nr:AMP-binding protein [Streptomyces alanosinicus]GHD98028.1 AMP-dependent synthetase [Streptomyces alanosinicus]
MAATYVTRLIAALEGHAGRPALGGAGLGGRVLDHGALLEEVYRIAGVLADAGVRRGSGLACVLGANRAQALLLRTAAHVLGARLTLVVRDASTYGVAHMLRDCRPDLVVYDVPVPDTGTPRLPLAEVLARAACREAVAVPVAAREDDVARVAYTGGTTGLPKGVASTFRALAARPCGQNMCGAEGRHGPGASGTYISVTSLAARSGGRCLEQWRAGGRVEVLSAFGAGRLAAACRRLGPASTYLMPPMIYRLLEDPRTADGIPGLEAISYGAAPILPQPLRRAVTAWGCRWEQGYGTTETSVITRLSPADHAAAVAGRPWLLGSVGRPAAGVEIEVREPGDAGRPLPAGRVGEVWVRSAAGMSGYWMRPDLTAQVLRDGWLRTGDLGHLDGEGRLYLDDRVKDMVVVDGDNIYSLPVEAALARHPAVGQAAVVGRSSVLTGEEVCAFLVPAPGRTASRSAAVEACALVARQLSPAHRPATVRWTERLPLTGNGKVDKGALRAMAAGTDTGPGRPPSPTIHVRI